MPLDPFENASSTATPLTRAPQPKAVPETTIAAMEAFSCLADKCPDTCCRDWAVPIDRGDLDRMKTAMAATAEGRERLVRLVVIGRPSRGSAAPAHLHLDESGACPMLDEDQRCGVHATLGEPVLSTACSIFPRTALDVGEQIEVGGSLGCPEVARLMLLSEQPLRLAPATKPMLPRAYVGKTIAADATDAYKRHFIDVRAALSLCFQQPMPLGTQLALAADFAERVQPFFHAGTRDFDGAQRPFAERRLRGELEATAAKPLREALDADLRALNVPGEPTMSRIATFLLERKQLPHSARFAALVDQVFAGSPELSPTTLWRVYVQRRHAVETRAGAAAATVFRNYCQHFLLRNPYTDSATLLEHLYLLGMHLGAVRLLTVLHPDVEARLAEAPEPDADAETLRRVAVHVVQTFTKAIGHHPEYLEAALRQTGPVTFGRLVLLAKFV
ncbi:MAG TPA: flagellin lysine-N-methylase [Polyangia bacterium]|jgi:lysine-N-methylase